VKLLDLFFPKKCVGCGMLGKYVCDECETGLWEEEQICPVCARNSRYGTKHKYCYKPWSLDGLTCFWAYEAIAKKLITRAKYGYFYDCLNELIVQSSWLIDRPEYKEFWWFLDKKPVVVPVPLHPKRQKMRGFNQAEIIGRHIALVYNLPFANLLIRIKDTGRQVGKTRDERLNNLQNAFAIHGKITRPVLLVDDVWTTGTTMSECAKVLKNAGVKNVWGLVLAR
jgi:competence protein ComFC